MILGYSVIQPLRVAPTVSSPTGSVGGLACRLYACIEPDACVCGVQSETLRDISAEKYCMRMGAILNAYMLTPSAIYEKITKEVSSLSALDALCMLSNGHINN